MRKALYILGELEEADIRWMAAEGRTRAVEAGETLIAAGAPIEAFFVVIDGHFDVSLPNGRAIAELAAGDIIGEMSLVEKRPPSASVIATAAARVMELDQATLRARLEREPAFAARFYRALAVFLSDRLRMTVARLGFGPADDALDRFEEENALDEGVLDNVHVAGDRMRRLSELLEGG